jgi:CBS domain-containing protein
MLLGGVSQVTRLPRRPRYEALMALAGPVTSLVLGLLLLALHRASATAPADVKMGIFYLGSINLTLGVFNLIPAFPMDGGRILRALLSSRIGAARATRVAAGVGRVAAVLMALAGLWAGNFLLLMVALFVYFGAGSEALSERMRQALEGLSIADLVPLIRRPPATISKDALLSEVLPRMHEAGRLELVVTDAEGAPVTILQAADLITIGAEDRAHLHVRDLADRVGPRYVLVPWDAGANDVLERMATERVPYIIVADPAVGSPHGMVGLVTASDIQTMLTLRLLESGDNPPLSAPPPKTTAGFQILSTFEPPRTRVHR